MSSAGRLLIDGGKIAYFDAGQLYSKPSKEEVVELFNKVAGQLEYTLNLLAPLRKELAGTKELLAATQRSFAREKERADAMADAINQRTGDDQLSALLKATIKAASNRANACGWEVGGIDDAVKAILTAGYKQVTPLPAIPSVTSPDKGGK